jgi:hypothetical protein
VGTLHLRERGLGIVLDAVYKPNPGGSARLDLLAGVDELGEMPDR